MIFLEPYIEHILEVRHWHGDYFFSESDVSYLSHTIAESGRQFWREEAGRFLHTTLYEYQYAIKIGYDSDNMAYLYLDKSNPLVEALEDGASSYDLLPGFLKGASSRIIPMRGHGGGLRFRTASHNSHSKSWIHPGFRGLHLENIVEAHIETVIAPQVIRGLRG